MASLKLVGSFSEHFCQEIFFCRRGLTIGEFDDSSFQVGWQDTRSQGSVGDVGDFGKKNVKVCIQQFSVNGIKITLFWDSLL